jgi:hypothetical protein
MLPLLDEHTLKSELSSEAPKGGADSDVSIPKYLLTIYIVARRYSASSHHVVAWGHVFV